ncbi:preprotein translocase subunit SecY [Haliovirga abyssi]|uniref:Protein translocase subunit SecY n=1 Tax=Haliovirga abyssi TaxID=2996794 RepID=A0AAU9DMM2_9FUSO|nr:preprotein translocase subunit SecY [Haliovirga abyssi]BDU49543.1 protein translocase subunit SecY [Haliovirga abyssi]
MSMLQNFSDKIMGINKIPDLRKKVIFTLIMFLVARVGTHIPSPGVDVARLTSMVNTNDILGFINMFSGGAFKRVSIFALGVMPYINASIVVQLLTVIVPQLEEMQKEERERAKIVQWTRYLTIIIGGIQGFGVSIWLQSMGLVYNPGFLFLFTTVTILTAGTVFLMWLGEQITVNGVGNGISLIIFLNIIARMPAALIQSVQKMSGSKFFIIEISFLILIVVAITAAIVAFQLANRKIPIQYAGKGFGGKNSIASKTYLPLKINTAGVIPIIFASVLLMLPAMLVKALPNTDLRVFLERIFSTTSPVYLTLYAALVIFFTFFYTAIMFDPEKVAENLKKSGGTIPGIRPGSETVDYLEKVVTRITFGGAIFLALIAIVPMLIFGMFGLPVYISGTGLLIIVGVALDTVQQINANLVVREYEGFLS